MDFGEALRRTMFEFRISGAKLGRETGVNSSQISEFKNGGASLSVVNLQKVIQALSPEQQAELIRQLQAQAAAQQQAALKAADEAEAKASGDDTGFDETRPETWGNLGRNDACPCGSGKKFKHCHGRLA